jgi:hypothetical protein
MSQIGSPTGGPTQHMYYCSHLSHMVNIVRFSIFQYLPNDMRTCPFIHVSKYCHDLCLWCPMHLYLNNVVEATIMNILDRWQIVPG